MAWYDWIAPAAGVAGLAGSETAGNLLSSWDIPRQKAWEGIGKFFGGSGTTSGSQLLNELFGMDPEGFGAQLGGTVLETALDPMNLLGAGMLSKAGGLVGRAGSNLAARAAARNAVASELGAVNKMRSAATSFIPTASAAEDIARAAPMQPGRMMENLNVPSDLGATYSQDILRELPEVTDLGRRDTMHTYKRMAPEVTETVDRLGLGYPTEGGTFTYQRPTFTRGSGGTMRPFGDMPTGPALQGAGGQPIGLPQLEEMSAGVRVEQPMRVTGGMPLPQMGEMIGRPSGLEQAAMYRAMPGALAETAGGARHLLDMPLEEGLGAANQRATELRRALLELSSEEQLSPLERWLSQTRFGQF